MHTWSETIAQCCYRCYRRCQCWCFSWCCWYCYDVAIASVILIVDVNVADIDECCSFSPCGLNTHCTNTEGSYTCECNFGFSRDVVNTDDCGKEMIVLLDIRIFYFAYFISVKWRWLATKIIIVLLFMRSQPVNEQNKGPGYSVSCILVVCFNCCVCLPMNIPIPVFCGSLPSYLAKHRLQRTVIWGFDDNTPVQCFHFLLQYVIRSNQDFLVVMYSLKVIHWVGSPQELVVSQKAVIFSCCHQMKDSLL